MAAGLALAGPVSLDALRDLIPPPAWREDIPRDPGATVVPALARAFIARGNRVTLISYAIGLEQEIVINAGPLRLCIGPGRVRGRARDFFAAERKYLLAALAREQPALVHAHWTYEFAMAAQASSLPCLVTAHDAPLRILRHDPSPYRCMRTMMAYAVLHRAKRIVAVSRHVEQHVRRWVGYRGQCTVIPNGIEDRIFHARPPRAGSAIVFASVLNGWGGVKNPITLLRAFAQIRKHLPQARLKMFGEGYGPDGPAASWASAHAVQSGVDFVGVLPHAELLDRLHTEADILVHPSLEESQSMAIAEAMACSIPVIGGIDSGAVPWTLDAGRAGLLTDVRSPRSLGEAMLGLACNPAQQQSLARSGFEYAMRQFSLQTVADRYAEIYTELCGTAWH